MSRTTDLEDRVLILQDQVDVLEKAFDPGQPRDKDGKWTEGGGGPNMSRRGFLGGLLSAATTAQVPAKVLAALTGPSSIQEYLLHAADISVDGSTSAFSPGQFSVKEALEVIKDTERAYAPEHEANWIEHEGGKPSARREYYLLGDDKVPYKWDPTANEFVPSTKPPWTKDSWWTTPAEEKAQTELWRKQGEAKRKLRDLERERERSFEENRSLQEKRGLSVHHASDLDEFVAGRIRFRKLMDRVLVLQDQVDVVTKALDPSKRKKKRARFGEGGRPITSRTATIDVVGPSEVGKAFDPNEPRDEKGRWSAAADVGRTARRVARGSVKVAATWLSQSKVAQAVKAGDYNETAKEIVASTIAAIVTTHNNSDAATEAVKQSILHAAVGMKVTANEARERVSQTLNRLRTLRRREKPDVAKAEDAVLALLTKIIDELDALELDDLALESV